MACRWRASARKLMLERLTPFTTATAFRSACGCAGAGSLRGDDFVGSYAALVVHWVGNCWVLQGRCPASTNQDQRSPEPPRRSVVSRVSARCPEGKQKISTRMVLGVQTTGLIVHPLFTFAGPSGHVTRVRSPHRKTAGTCALPNKARRHRASGFTTGECPPSCEGYA